MRQSPPLTAGQQLAHLQRHSLSQLALQKRSHIEGQAGGAEDRAKYSVRRRSHCGATDAANCKADSPRHSWLRQVSRSQRAFYYKYHIHSASLNELPPLRPVLRCLGTMEAARTRALLGWWQSSQTALLRMLLGECALCRSLFPSVRLWGRVFTRQALPSARSSTPSAVW